MKKYLVIFTSFFALCLINVSTAAAILPQCQPAKTGAKISNVPNPVTGQPITGVRKITINGCPLQVTQPIKMAVAYEGGGSADGAAYTTGNNTGQIQVLGIQITYGAGGPAVPVRLDSKLSTDTDFSARFSGADLTVGAVDILNVGSTVSDLTFRAKASYDSNNADGDNNHWTGAEFSRQYLSDSINPAQAIVAIDGDNINAIIAQKGIQLPYGNQLPISSVIQSYVDPQGNVYLDPNRVLILFELGTTNPASAAYDFQDLVLVLDLEGIVQAPDYVFGDTAIGTPTPSYPTDVFDWSMVRAAPGGSRIKGLAYQRTSAANAADRGTRTIRACIAASGTNPSWTTCSAGTVLPVTANVAGDQKNTADMAMNDNGFHGVGWVAYNNSSGLIKYLASFTKDNGVSWDAAPREIGRYDNGIGPDNIDLASNEAGSIGVLVYYKTTVTTHTDMYGTVNDSLVLYTYNKNVDPTLNNPVKTVIVSGSGAQFASGCKGNCFALTGDGSDTFEAFYYEGGAAKVSTVSSASTSPSASVRVIVNNGSVTLLDAASTCHAPSPNAGAAVVIASGTGIGTYDVPSLGNIIKRSSNVQYGGLADSVYTMALTRTNTSSPGVSVMAYREGATGQLSNIAISDSLPYPQCPQDGHNVGQNCSLYLPDIVDNGHTAAVIGNVAYASSFRQDYVWNSTANMYLASVQRIVIHQTSADM